MLISHAQEFSTICLRILVIVYVDGTSFIKNGFCLLLLLCNFIIYNAIHNLYIQIKYIKIILHYKNILCTNKKCTIVQRML